MKRVFCIVVDDESPIRYDFKNVENNMQALFLLKDIICRIDMKILQWESPFHLDVEFIEQVYKNDRVVLENNAIPEREIESENKEREKGQSFESEAGFAANERWCID